LKIKQYLLITIMSLSLALVFRFFVLTTYRVPTGAMQPALKPGDFIVSSPLVYGFPIPLSNHMWFWSAPQRGDVVVFSYPQQPEVNYVKRVVAVGGDVVEIKNDVLIVNGVAATYSAVEDLADNPDPASFKIVTEQWQQLQRRLVVSNSKSTSNFGPLTLAGDEYFLIGDNRDASDDSRNWGAVPKAMIKSKVIQIWLSLDWQSKWAQNRFPKVRWERMFSRVY